MRTATAIVLLLVVGGLLPALAQNNDQEIKELKERLSQTERRVAQLQGREAMRRDGEWNPLQLHAEVLWARYLQEGGTIDGDADEVDFGYEPSVRLAAGVVGKTGLGLRLRYWGIEHEGNSDDGDLLAVKARNVDLELFQQESIGTNTMLEFAIGLRKSDFTQQSQEDSFPPGFVNLDYEAWGPSLEVGIKHHLGIGAIYGRGRLSLLVGDLDLVDGDTSLSDDEEVSGHQVLQIELALGYEVTLKLGDAGSLTLHVGGEWQNWSNLAPLDEDFDGIGNDDLLADAGFFGVTGGATFEF